MIINNYRTSFIPGKVRALKLFRRTHGYFLSGKQFVDFPRPNKVLYCSLHYSFKVFFLSTTRIGKHCTYKKVLVLKVILQLTVTLKILGNKKLTDIIIC